MGNAVIVKIEGLQQLGQNLQQLGNAIGSKIARKAPREAAVLVQNEAKAIATGKGLIKTGAMITAIQVRRDRRASKPGIDVYSVGVFRVPGGKYANTKKNRRMRRVGLVFEQDSPQYYWRFAELGTVKESAKPFLRPALDADKAAATEKMKEEIYEGIKKQILQGQGFADNLRSELKI